MEEVGLARNVSALRKLLAAGDDSRSYIETVPKRGYRFVAAVTESRDGDLLDGHAVSPDTSSATAQVSTPGEIPAAVAPDAQAAPRSTWWRPLVLISLAALVGVGGALVLWQRVGTQAPLSPHRSMLVVLPVQNLTGDPSREYISDGMTEELIATLGSLDPERVGVIARTSSMAYKQTTKTAAQIGRELGVDYVLESSLRGNAQRTRFTAQLVRTTDQSHLWARDYDRDSQNLLALEDEIGQTVAREIDVRLTAQAAQRDERRRVVNPVSHEAYLLARYYWNQGDEASLRRSIELYRGALAKDPQNALAYAGSADAYTGLSDFYLPPRAVMPEAKAAVLSALQIDESLSAAHNALCVVLTNYEWNWSAAERECRRAIELNPNSSDAHDSYGMALAYLGRFAQSAAELRRAQELDPLSFRI